MYQNHGQELAFEGGGHEGRLEAVTPVNHRESTVSERTHIVSLFQLRSRLNY